MVALVLFVAGWQNLHGQITLNAFAGFLTALLLAQQPVRNLSQLWPTASAGIAAAEPHVRGHRRAARASSTARRRSR